MIERWTQTIIQVAITWIPKLIVLLLLLISQLHKIIELILLFCCISFMQWTFDTFGKIGQTVCIIMMVVVMMVSSRQSKVTQFYIVMFV